MPCRPPSSAAGKRFNRRYARSGHLWQGRFFSCPLGRDPLVTALAYVDLNPCLDYEGLRAHLVGRAGHYPWSSAAAHLAGHITAGHNAAGLLDLGLWREIPSAVHWADALELPPTEQDTARLRQPTLAGLPLGESEFAEDPEHAFARRRLPGRPGRKPKSAAVAA